MNSKSILSIMIQARDNASGIMSKVGNATDTLRSKASGLAKGGFVAVTVAARAMATALTIGIGIMAGFSATVATYGLTLAVSYESQLSSIQALTGSTSDQMKSVGDLAMTLGKKTKFSALEAAKGAEELLKAGLTLEQVMGGGLAGALDLAAAGGIGVADAAEIASTALNAFAKDGMTVSNAADILAGAANASATDVTQLRFALSMSSAVAAGVGFTFRDTSTALALFAQNGLKGSDAGTSLKTMLMNLQPVTLAQHNLWDELGLSFYNAAGEMKPLAEVAEELKSKFAGMTDQQRALAFETAFGSDAIRAANVLYKEGAEGVTTMSDAMGQFTAAQVAAAKTDNLAGSLERLKSTLDTKLIEVFSGPLPGLAGALNKVQVATEAIDLQPLLLSLDKLFLAFQESPAIREFLTNTWNLLVESFAYFQSDVLPFVIESLIILEDWFTVNGPIIQEFVEGTWTDLINGFNKFSSWVNDNRVALENFGLIILGFALGFGLVALALKIYIGVLAAYAFMTGVVTVVTAGFGIALAFATSPLFLIALAIGAVIVIGLLLWRHWGFLSAKAREVFAAIGSFIGMIVQTVVRDFQTFQNKAANIATAITRSFNNIKSGVGNALKGTVNELIRNLNNATAGVNGIIRNIPALPGLGKIPEIPRIPSFRSGVTNFEGGLAFVHQGEMLMNLAKGTTVKTASQTRNMLSAAGGPQDSLPANRPIVINITVGSYLGTERDKRIFADDMAAATAEALKKLETE